MFDRKILLAGIVTLGLMPSAFAESIAGPISPMGGKAVSASQLSQLLLHGNYPVTNGYQPLGVHAGIDFGNTGDGVTSVYSPVNGTITANTAACGKVAIYDGSNTLIFAHMTARTTLSEGSRITAGTYVGKASRVVGGGCTVTGPHLHLEIQKGNHPIMANPTQDNRGSTIDPLSYNYDNTPPTIGVTSPARNAALSGGGGAIRSRGRRAILQVSGMSPWI